MADIDVTVKFTGSLKGKKVAVDFKNVALSGNSGKARVEANERTNLFWGVVGDPGTKYEITLTPSAGKLDMEGKHPIEGKVTKREFMAGGHRYFRVKE